jgi:flagellar FliL protein
MFKRKPKAGAATEAPAEGAEGEAAAGKKKPNKKMLIMMAAAGLLVVGGGGAGAMMFLGGGKAKAGDDAHGAKEAKPKKKAKKGGDHKGGDKAAEGAPVITEGPDGVVFYTMPDILVNIQSPDGKPSYLKLKLTLELPDHETAEALEPATPRLNDMFSTFLRELRPEDLSGSQGTYELRMEILKRVNLVAAPAEVKAVLIEEMLITG